MTADRDKAREIVREHRIKHGTMQRPDELADAIATALSAARAEERERAAKVAEDYAFRMAATAAERGAQGKPNMVATCKADAGSELAAAIRADGQADKGEGR